ncbi:MULTISPECIES: 3',5'-cyclic-nucleotide phosphodiesterase [Acidithiobacillus]|jgi:cAMP phosphodiesterase|uniref:3',5'-cyclic-nucleotide phosphodiesterase n=1 Tax=Acidithiobacillus TaxID=119977 RepID=UPI00231F5058|nr:MULTISPECIES: 3',5'-cyclic-nucleotide phosphodiesterase [Acidithiobacillus]MBW9248363.1 MBL fold metallo-hydrolase [Acidithiobacillus ferriphilus]MBW9253722.1 MBL fold metallo-hydrolase [Acidithiobacillus ferriphilus]MDA8246348.1 3',5'-cyclic-nucleotide phosphodiesterase [Acidithiobacillus sp.]
MRLKVLGCSGGIGGNLRTTAFLIDDDILIDGGTGLVDLSIEELARIDHIFVTHSHLDHTACIPLMIDSVARYRDKPIRLYATTPVMRILRQHMFNWLLWPDFSCIPSEEKPFVTYHNVALGEPVTLGDRKITPLPAEHVVPAVGYHLNSGRSSLVFTGDTTCNNALWDVVNRIDNLGHLIIETAFSDAQKDISVLSKHLCPSLLVSELANLTRPATVYLTHFKPCEEDVIIAEVRQSTSQFTPQVLYRNQVIEF